MKELAIVLTASITLGAALDRLLLHRHKTFIYSQLLSYWYFVATTSPAQWYTFAIRYTKTILGLQEREIRFRYFIKVAAGYGIGATLIATILGKLVYQDYWEFGLPVSGSLKYLIIGFLITFISFMLGALILKLMPQFLEFNNVLITLSLAIVVYIISAISLVLVVSNDLRITDRTQVIKERTIISTDHNSDIEKLLTNENVMHDFLLFSGGHMGFSQELSYKWDKEMNIKKSIPMSLIALWEVFRYGYSDLPALLWVEILKRTENENEVVFRGQLQGSHRISFSYTIAVVGSIISWLIFSSIYIVLVASSIVQRFSRHILTWILELLVDYDPDKNLESFAPFTKLGVLLGLFYGIILVIKAIWG